MNESQLDHVQKIKTRNMLVKNPDAFYLTYHQGVTESFKKGFLTGAVIGLVCSIILFVVCRFT